MRAAQHGHANLVTLLLDKGAKIDIARKVMFTACMKHVIDNQDIECLEEQRKQNKKGGKLTICRNDGEGGRNHESRGGRRKHKKLLMKRYGCTSRATSSLPLHIDHHRIYCRAKPSLKIFLVEAVIMRAKPF